jgi:hypothetical protein
MGLKAKYVPPVENGRYWMIFLGINHMVRCKVVGIAGVNYVIGINAMKKGNSKHWRSMCEGEGYEKMFKV